MTSPSPEPFTPSELAAWRGLLETHARLTSALDAELQSAHGLSLSAYEVLMLLGEAPERRLRMSELAAGALLSRSGCTRLVDRLVALGHLTRSAADGDRRGLCAELTPAGGRLLAAARVTHRAGVRRRFLDHLSAADERELAVIWGRIGSRPPSRSLARTQASRA